MILNVIDGCSDIILNQSVMGKGKGNRYINIVTRPKRRLLDHFDPSHGMVTPNQRSLPKYRNLFDKPTKPTRKDPTKRHSQGKVPARGGREEHSAGKALAGRSGQKMSRY